MTVKTDQNLIILLYLQDLIKILEEAGQDVPNELVTMAEKYEAFREREAEARKQFGRSFQGGGGCYNW